MLIILIHCLINLPFTCKYSGVCALIDQINPRQSDSVYNLMTWHFITIKRLEISLFLCVFKVCIKCVLSRTVGRVMNGNNECLLSSKKFSLNQVKSQTDQAPFRSKYGPKGWRKHYYGLWTYSILARSNSSVSYKLAAFQNVNYCTESWELLADYYVFISCFDFHSDGTHSLQRIHWWASDATLNVSKPVPWSLF